MVHCDPKLNTTKGLYGLYVNSGWTFFALLNLKANTLAFLQGPEALHIDRGMVDKNVLILTIHFNKAKTFFLVKPLNASFWHSHSPPLEVFLKLGYDYPSDTALFFFILCPGTSNVHQLRPLSTPYWVDNGF
jgi:hypothetical protein